MLGSVKEVGVRAERLVLGGHHLVLSRYIFRRPHLRRTRVQSDRRA